MSHLISSENLIYFGLFSHKFIPHSNSWFHLLDFGYGDIFEKLHPHPLDTDSTFWICIQSRIIQVQIHLFKTLSIKKYTDTNFFLNPIRIQKINKYKILLFVWIFLDWIFFQYPEIHIQSKFTDLPTLGWCYNL